jgi:hypothetical protein
VNTIAECTVPEKVLMAAHLLEERGQSPFSAEALVVSAWQKYPKSFGLKGYEEHHPDSNKVLTAIMGEKGLAKRGWLLKVGRKLYSLTREGRLVVRRLFQADDLPPPVDPSNKISREQEGLLLALLANPAVDRFQQGRQEELRFPDACRFWSITQEMSADALDARLDHISAILAAVERQIGLGSATLSNGRVLTAEDMGRLADVHMHLLQRFARHLALLRDRAGRR